MNLPLHRRLAETVKVILTEDDVVLRVTVPIEFVNSGTDEADLTLELLNPVGRS